jgi:hypothetical protein
VEKGDGSTFFPTAGGEPKSVATIQVALNGCVIVWYHKLQSFDIEK